MNFYLAVVRRIQRLFVRMTRKTLGLFRGVGLGESYSATYKAGRYSYQLDLDADALLAWYATRKTRRRLRVGLADLSGSDSWGICILGRRSSVVCLDPSGVVDLLDELRADRENGEWLRSEIARLLAHEVRHAMQLERPSFLRGCEWFARVLWDLVELCIPLLLRPSLPEAAKSLSEWANNVYYEHLSPLERDADRYGERQVNFFRRYVRVTVVSGPE